MRSRVSGFGFGVAGLLLAVASLQAGESRPSSQGDIKKGVERGAALRKQAALVREALQSSALVIKAGGVRCGHALTRIEDAKGAGGATYRLIEQYKAAMAEEGQTAVIEYDGTLLLGPDLGLISGELRNKSELCDTATQKRQRGSASVTLTVNKDELTWQRSDQSEGKEAVAKSGKTALHGVRPVPINALPALAALVKAGAEGGWQPNPKDAVCMPTLDPGPEMDSFAVQAVWVTFDRPGIGMPKGAAAQMRVRTLVCEVTEKGLEVDAPSPAVWQAAETFVLDEHCRPLTYPAPDDPRIAVEMVDPAALDANAALDLAKIGAAVKGEQR
jgi:hypothetical protein